MTTIEHFSGEYYRGIDLKSLNSVRPQPDAELMWYEPREDVVCFEGEPGGIPNPESHNLVYPPTALQIAKFALAKRHDIYTSSKVNLSKLAMVVLYGSGFYDYGDNGNLLCEVTDIIINGIVLDDVDNNVLSKESVQDALVRVGESTQVSLFAWQESNGFKPTSIADVSSIDKYRLIIEGEF